MYIGLSVCDNAQETSADEENDQTCPSELQLRQHSASDAFVGQRR
jgi:hypothetical protein